MPTKEQIKVRAAFLNSIASGSVVASTITPAVGLAIGVVEWSWERLGAILAASVCWFAVPVLVHVFAYRLAGQLE